MSDFKTPALYDLLHLLTIPNIGPGRIRKLLQVFEGVEQILKAPVQKLTRVEGIDLKLAECIKKGGETELARTQVALIKKHKINYILIWDKNYPAILKQIPDAPVILFYHGEFKDQHKKSIALVGTRTPSNYGRMVTIELVRQLVGNGLTIVSGMARGIDSIAHQIAIQNGGETLAVLGCGVDQCYPPENLDLYQKIPQHGAVISEYFVGTGPDAINFPKRNRIISGLSLGTVVIEAGERSGALITAFYALNQNREVYAVPGNINSPKSQGCNRLIKEGAKLVQTVDDILEEIGELNKVSAPEAKAIPTNLQPLEKSILENLGSDPKHIDRLVLDLKEAPSAILAGLLTLELLGLAQQLAGKMFVRI
jgi:DNA processing protein